MRVLMISHTCQSRTEGQPKAVCISRSDGIELRVLVPNRWLHYGKPRLADIPEENRHLVKAGRVRWPWVGPAKFFLHHYPGLGQLLKEYEPDIIDLWEEPWALVSYQACRLRNRLLPRTLVLSETEQNLNKQLPFPFESFRSYTLRNAQYAIARNCEAVSVLRSKGYVGPVDVVPNAVDVGLFHPMDRDVCRRDLILSGFVVGYVGRLVEEKGLMDIVNALPLCPKDVNAVFVGAGPFKEALQVRIAELSITERVRFIENKPLQELASVMNAFDALLLVSRTTRSWKEQFGRVIIEANACGTPVIGSDSGAIPDVIGKAGLVVPEQNPTALAEAIVKMRGNPEMREEMGRIGRKQIEENYTWERVAERMVEIYRRMMCDNADKK